MSDLRAPFPWFGGKSRVAHIVWPRFGDVPNYIEPFAGSLAVLLARPHAAKTETVNDLDAYLANFWRALRADPEAVARWAGDPVNEADLHARHLWLVKQSEFRERMLRDPDYHDVKIAGWWVWGLCLWIGSGWCDKPEWTGRANAGRRSRGIHSERAEQTARQVPHLSGGGMGVHRKLPSLGDGGRGVAAPSRQLPSLGDAGRDQPASSVRLLPYFQQLAERLARVRVTCGSWDRVVTPSVTTKHGVTAILLDPPYSRTEREDVYRMETDVACDVRDWAIANGDNPELRIALCGYDGEHAMPESWACVPWKAAGGYGSQSANGRGRENAGRERIWFSPHCIRPEHQQQTLFAGGAA